MTTINLTDAKQIFLSSQSSINTTANLNVISSYKSKYRFYIKDLLKRDPNVLYSTIKLIHAEIPYSFYVVNDLNKTFNFVHNGISYSISIPLGNYSSYSLITQLNTQLSTYGLSFSLNTTNGKFTLSHSNQNISFSILGITTCYKLIGTQKGVNYTSSQVGTTQIIQLPYPSDVSGTKCVYVKSPNLILDNLNTTNDDQTTLKSIPCFVPPFEIMFYNNSENVETLLKNRELDYIDVELTDDENNLVNMNNVDWAITIEITKYIQIQQNPNTSIKEYLDNLTVL
jgi:hypothetical protein